MAGKWTAGIAAAATLALLSTGAPAAAVEDVTTARFAGQDRYSTAVEVAAERVAGSEQGIEAVLLARADDFPDALSGAGLAGSVPGGPDAGAPILLTGRTALPAATRQALRDFSVRRVLLLGGPDAISEAVEDELAEDHDVTRVAGQDRYGTAAEAARALAATSGGLGAVDGRTTVLVASGADFADALAGGPVAYAGRLPILLTAPDELPDATEAVLDELDPDQAVVLGGEAAVSSAVQSALERRGTTTRRLGGADRQATAARIADFALAELGFDGSQVVLARGDDFPDALAGGPQAGRTEAPVLLTQDPTTLGSASEEWLAGHRDTVAVLQAVGGPSAVTPTAVGQAVRAAGGQVQPGSWQALPGAPIDRRLNHTATWAGDRLVVWGGGDPGPVRNDGAAWIPAEQRWEPVPAAPIAPRWAHEAVWTGSELIVWGGSEGPDHLADCYTDGARYDPVAGTWTAMAAAPGEGRCGALVSWTGSRLLVFGGHSGEGLRGELHDDGLAYDPVADSWSAIPSAPLSPSSGSVGGWSGSELVVWGGSGEQAEPTGGGAAFDPATGSWRTLATSPLPSRAAPVGAFVDGELIVFGGRDLDTGDYLTDAAAYDPETDSWRRLADLPAPHVAPRTASTGTGVLYVVGGDSRPDGQDEGAFLAYVADDDSWVVQPTPPGGARVNHAVAWSGSRLYVWGGQSHQTRTDPPGAVWLPPS